MKVVSLEERNGKTLYLFLSSPYLFLIKVMSLVLITKNARNGKNLDLRCLLVLIKACILTNFQSSSNLFFSLIDKKSPLDLFFTWFCLLDLVFFFCLTDYGVFKTIINYNFKFEMNNGDFKSTTFLIFF